MCVFWFTRYRVRQCPVPNYFFDRKNENNTSENKMYIRYLNFTVDVFTKNTCVTTLTVYNKKKQEYLLT